MPLLAPLAPPRVAHFCGHMFAADAAAEARLRAEIDAVLDEEDVGFAYGALACGADLLFAEAALARGVELHVVLPFEEEDFLAQSVRPGGEGWVARYRACRARAASVTVASPMEYFGDPAQYGYGSRMAMGLARLRAQHLGAEPVQIAIWDGAGVGRARPAPAPTSPPGRQQGGRSRDRRSRRRSTATSIAPSRGVRSAHERVARRDPVHRFRRLLDPAGDARCRPSGTG